jgi:hypothetical protein
MPIVCARFGVITFLWNILIATSCRSTHQRIRSTRWYGRDGDHNAAKLVHEQLESVGSRQKFTLSLILHPRPNWTTRRGEFIFNFLHSDQQLQWPETECPKFSRKKKAVLWFGYLNLHKLSIFLWRRRYVHDISHNWITWMTRIVQCAVSYRNDNLDRTDHPSSVFSRVRFLALWFNNLGKDRQRKAGSRLIVECLFFNV